VGPALRQSGHFGRRVELADVKAHRRDRRFAGNQSGGHKVVVTVRERDGNSVPAVSNSKSQAASFIRACTAKGTFAHADEAAAWDDSHERFEVERIDNQEAHRRHGACTDMAEESVSRLAGADLPRDAQECS
jgi:ISXO2-like transposase domain